MLSYIVVKISVSILGRMSKSQLRSFCMVPQSAQTRMCSLKAFLRKRRPQLPQTSVISHSSSVTPSPSTRRSKTRLDIPVPDAGAAKIGRRDGPATGLSSVEERRERRESRRAAVETGARGCHFMILIAAREGRMVDGSGSRFRVDRTLSSSSIPT